MKRTKKARVYFDYNIYEGINKEKVGFDNDVIKDNEIFMSVAHIEEYYKACQNDVDK